MARKSTKKTVTVTTPADETGETEEQRSVLDEIEDDAEESMALDLQAALAECGDAGQVSVQLIKVSPKEEAGACTTYASGELSIDRVREEWGAGVYKIFF